MPTPELRFSEDQAKAFKGAARLLRDAGVDIGAGHVKRTRKGSPRILAVLGRAGSGKTLLLSRLYRALDSLGVETVSTGYESRKRRDGRTLAVLAPTNKAASVLRGNGVPATTIHRILYKPLYDQEYEKVAEWLTKGGDRPNMQQLTEAALDRAKEFYKTNKSVPGALAIAGLSGSDFIVGWERRADPLDIALVDEASMLDRRQLADLEKIFPSLVLFGDPAQLAPVGQSGEMAFDQVERCEELSRVHRQAKDNPILDLAHALGRGSLGFDEFETLIEEAARRDHRVEVSPRVYTDLMARSPVLVWRNTTRVRLIKAFRDAHGGPEDELVPGEPLICDGIELPPKFRQRRIELEARGLVKGAHAIYLGPGRKRGFSRLHVIGAEEPQLSAASIIKIEHPDRDEPFIPFAARMGAAFLHGSAVTIHKSQGSQWPVAQVFAPDIRAAARSGLVESGLPLWKRLAYVAITRAQHRLVWVTRYALARPRVELAVDDLKGKPAPLALKAEEAEH